MNEKFIRGHEAEILVANLLRENGFIISKMNFHSRYGEIDIIAETRKGIHFIEVKMRSENAIAKGAEAVDAAKRKKIFLTAAEYIQKSHTEYLQPHFDVAELTQVTDTSDNSAYKLRYYPDAFEVNL